MAGIGISICRSDGAVGSCDWRCTISPLQGTLSGCAKSGQEVHAVLSLFLTLSRILRVISPLLGWLILAGTSLAGSAPNELVLVNASAKKTRVTPGPDQPLSEK